MTFSALTGLNFNYLHSYKAAHLIPLFHIHAELNGFLDTTHQLVKALCLSVAAGKLRNGGNIIAVFVLSYHYVELHWITINYYRVHFSTFSFRMTQKAGVSDTQARLHGELFRAMLEEPMSGRLPAGGGAGGGRERRLIYQSR